MALLWASIFNHNRCQNKSRPSCERKAKWARRSDYRVADDDRMAFPCIGAFQSSRRRAVSKCTNINIRCLAGRRSIVRSCIYGDNDICTLIYQLLQVGRQHHFHTSSSALICRARIDWVVTPLLRGTERRRWVQKPLQRREGRTDSMTRSSVP